MSAETFVEALPFGLSEAYFWILLEIVLMCLQCMLHGFAVMGVRKELFTKAFFEKNFPEVRNLTAHTGSNGGYPDGGSGHFASRLSLDEWLKLNNYVRAHYNYLEGLTPIVLFHLISGLYYTKLTLLMGVLYIIGRQMYAIGYRAKGPSGRGYGVLLVDIALLITLITSIMTVVHYGGGLNGLIRLISK